MLLWLKDCATGFCISEAQSIGYVRKKKTSELNWPKPTTLEGSNTWKKGSKYGPFTGHLPLKPVRKNSGIEAQSHPGIQLAQVCRGPPER